MTLTGATPVQYSRGGFEENRKYLPGNRQWAAFRPESFDNPPPDNGPTGTPCGTVREGPRRRTPENRNHTGSPGRPPGRGLSRLDKVQKFGLQGARQKQKREAQPRAARSSWQKQRGRRIRIPECQKHCPPSPCNGIRTRYFYKIWKSRNVLNTETQNRTSAVPYGKGIRTRYFYKIWKSRNVPGIRTKVFVPRYSYSYSYSSAIRYPPARPCASSLVIHGWRKAARTSFGNCGDELLIMKSHHELFALPSVCQTGQ